MILKSHRIFKAAGTLPTFTSVRGTTATGPAAFTLIQDYPNPFNPKTEIKVAVAAGGHVSLTVHDLLGREVANLVTESLPTSTYSVDFEARGLASGVYLHRLEQGQSASALSMLILP